MGTVQFEPPLVNDGQRHESAVRGFGFDFFRLDSGEINRRNWNDFRVCKSVNVGIVVEIKWRSSPGREAQVYAWFGWVGHHLLDGPFKWQTDLAECAIVERQTPQAPQPSIELLHIQCICRSSNSDNHSFRSWYGHISLSNFALRQANP